MRLTDKKNLAPLLVGLIGLAAAAAFHRALIDWFTFPAAPPAEEPPHQESTVPDPALVPIRAALFAYETVRDSLARDSLVGVDNAATAVAHHLSQAEAAVGSAEELSGRLHRAGAAASALAAAKELAEARARFSELNRELVVLIASDHRLQGNLQLYECSMFGGFAKWFQSSRDIENPYMGRAMTACGEASAWEGGSDIAYYTCAMHTSVRKKDPGSCPICGMKLTPVTREESEEGVIFIDEARRQSIGVRTGAVFRGPMTLGVRAFGKVAYDERKLTDVTIKVKGWIAKLYVEETGKRVKRGDPLFALYSPELYAAQAEYLQALQGVRSGSSRLASLAEAAKLKLKLWDLSDAQIARIAAQGKPVEHVTFFAPSSGYVVEKSVVEGAAIEPGQRIFRIADLSEIWIEAEVYEKDLERITVGQPVNAELVFVPDQKLEGKVDYVYPTLDPATRTGRVRVVMANAGLALKPGMYANLTFEADLGERLQVPAEAVIYTGPRRIVFLDLGGGRLRPAAIEVGARSQETYEVISGLSEGQQVVTSGNFLVAAESRLRSGGGHGAR